MFKSISKGFDFSVGFRKQLLTFIYVEDLSRAVFDALEKAPVKETYDISEPRGYTEGISPAYSQGYRQEGRIPVRMPLWGVKAVSVIAEKNRCGTHETIDS